MELKLKVGVTTASDTYYEVEFVDVAGIITQINVCKPDCNMEFGEVAQVMNGCTINPLIRIDKPLGIELTTEICKILSMKIYHHKITDEYRYVVNDHHILTVKNLGGLGVRISDWIHTWESDNDFGDRLPISHVPQDIWDHIQTRL